MAKNITLLGANYPDVPAVELPETGGGTATFTDITDTTAVEQDVDTGKVFYKASGARSIGTGTSGVGKMDLVSNPTTGNVLITDSNGQAQDAGVEPIYYDTVASGVDTVTVGIDMDLLWTNANPSAVFNAQTVSLDLSAYNYVYIVGQNNHSGEGWAQCIWPVPCSFATLTTPTYTPGRDYVQARNMVITTTSIEFKTCDDSRNSCKPFKIYGIR